VGTSRTEDDGVLETDELIPYPVKREELGHVGAGGEVHGDTRLGKRVLSDAIEQEF